jgi:hypothetical protein
VTVVDAPLERRPEGGIVDTTSTPTTELASIAIGS